MSKSALKNSIIKGAAWSIGGQLTYLIITLGANIWLARILSAKEFGQIAIIMFFISLTNVFIESGLGGALIRKKEISKADYSTVFVFNLFISIICFLLLLILSPYIASFYDDPALKNLLSVTAIILIFNAFQIVQWAKITHDLRFKQKSIYQIISVLAGTCIGIILAYYGFGTWALVIMQLSTAIFQTFLFWINEGVFFTLNFNKMSFKSLYGFGVNTTLASLLSTAFDNIYQLVLGKYFSITQVGYYYQAKRLQDAPGGIVNMFTNSVLYSSLSKIQGDNKRFNTIFRKIRLALMVLLGFFSCFIYIYADQLISLILGDTWLMASIYLKLLTIASFFYFQELVYRIIFKIYDKTQIILYLELLKKGVQIITIIIGILSLNIYVLLLGFIITNIISYILYANCSIKILHDNEELFAIIKVILICFLSIVVISYINSFFSGCFVFFTAFPLLLFYWLGVHCLRVINVSDLFNDYKEIFNKQ